MTDITDTELTKIAAWADTPFMGAETIRALVAALRSERTQTAEIEAERDAWKARAREAVRQRDNEARKKQDVWDRLSAELERERTQNRELREAVEVMRRARLSGYPSRVSVAADKVLRVARSALSTQEESK